MSEKLIRESDVIKLIDEWLDNYPLPRHVEKGLASHEELLAYIADAPTIEAKPVVHAHWATDFDFDPEEEQELYFHFCSKCKNELFGNKDDFKYCPYCGAQMDEVASDNNVGGKTENDEKIREEVERIRREREEEEQKYD